MDSGIYLITCSPAGKRPTYYVGQSKNVSARLRHHAWQLRTRRHHNTRLQFAWEKYGEGAFRFELLEACDVADLDDCEQWWLDEMVGHQSVFNFGTTSGSAMRGLRFTPEHRRKISAALTGKKRRPLTETERLAVSLRLKGKPKTEEEKRKNSEAQKGEKNHMFGRRGALSPFAKRVEGRNLRDGSVLRLECMKEAKALGFQPSKISQCCNGSRTHHKGYAWRFVSR